MLPTPEQSADLKWDLKHQPANALHFIAAESNPEEADEAIMEVVNGYDISHPASWVARMIAKSRASV